MKKLVFAIGVVAFLVIGGFAVESTAAVQTPTDKVVYDDPPKKEKKATTKSDCTTKPGKTCCSQKSASSKKACDDKAPVRKDAKVSTDKDKK